ncbi:hypothetical protein K1719_028072 [Acacia pycnantha]|nr:hypothetical protein K1719_028072 [Acacia pycnantha]
MDLFSVRRRKTSLCCLLNNEASYGYDLLEDNLRLLETRWEKLQERKKDVEAACLEENIEETQRCHQVISGWLKRMESIEEQITDIQVRGNEQTKRKWLCGYFPRYGKSSYKLGKNVAKILRIVDELETEGEQFHGDFKIALKHLHKPNEMPCGETVGLDLMFEKVWRSIEETNIGIIGLYGMGGVGKTTLLKKVNNELAKRSGFYIVWVVVSKSPNLDSIMDDIREFIGIGDDIWNCCRNQDRKAREIYKVLKTKKFVLLLDDIWHRLDLEKVGVPHPKETNFQSKVLFTTRFEDVCAKMNAQREFKVEVLTEKEALELFCMKVGEETLKSSPVIRSIAQEMARDCKGLPLALSVVGSAMAGVKSVEAWQHSINNLAEDYVILEHHLIFQWIGEGFLDIDGMRSVHDMYCRGGSIIEKLKLSCLLENAEDDIFFEPSIKMHNVIRDMALWIARDQDRNKRKIIVQEDARAIFQHISHHDRTRSILPVLPAFNDTVTAAAFDAGLGGLSQVEVSKEVDVSLNFIVGLRKERRFKWRSCENINEDEGEKKGDSSGDLVQNINEDEGEKKGDSSGDLGKNINEDEGEKKGDSSGDLGKNINEDEGEKKGDSSGDLGKNINEDEGEKKGDSSGDLVKNINEDEGEKKGDSSGDLVSIISSDPQ